jgi:hypothetical protein
VGDIIRIHRANVGLYKNFKTFMCNIDFGTSWALFKCADPNKLSLENGEEKKRKEGVNIRNFMQNEDSKEAEHSNDQEMVNDDLPDVHPYSTSKPEFTLNGQDKARVADLRDWSLSHFQSDVIFDSALYVPLSKVKEKL